MLDLKELLEMFEENPLSQAVVDADLRIVLVNLAFEKMVGYSKDRLIGMKFTDFKDKSMIKYL